MRHRPDQIPETLVPPDAPPELRLRVLTAAREAMDGATAPDLWTRIWESRPVRMAWAASIGVLVFGHLVIGGSVSTGPAESAFPLIVAIGTNDELAEIIGLQRMTVDLPGWEIAPKNALDPMNQSVGKEDLS